LRWILQHGKWNVYFERDDVQMQMERPRLWNYEKLNDSSSPPPDLREKFKDWKFPEVPIGRETIYGWRVFGYDPRKPEKLKIGYGSDISVFSVIFAHEGVTIEPYVQIGPHSSIISKSTIDNKKGQVWLKRNCRIGAYSTIMPGITVGENSIIGAYSMVTSDVPDNVMGYGVPFKVIRQNT
jgi:acetyltransferase-like isoleucine patch superfamily enzyme